MCVIASNVIDTTDYLLCSRARTNVNLCGNGDFDGQVDVIAFDGGRVISIVDHCDSCDIDAAIQTVIDNADQFPVSEECGDCEEVDGEFYQCDGCAREACYDHMVDMAEREYHSTGIWA